MRSAQYRYNWLSDRLRDLDSPPWVQPVAIYQNTCVAKRCVLRFTLLKLTFLPPCRSLYLEFFIEYLPEASFMMFGVAGGPAHLCADRVPGPEYHHWGSLPKSCTPSMSPLLSVGAILRLKLLLKTLPSNEPQRVAVARE